MSSCAVQAPTIVWLGDEADVELGLLGGKAGSLSRLAADYPVPPGFAVTAAAWAEDSDPAGGRTLPASLAAAVASAYARLGRMLNTAEPSVAVRSSALDEDGAETSFAGQHETYLNVVGVEAVIEAIARCWASARSERAAAYRRRHGLSSHAGIAVLVQHLVSADVSAVVFSANPVTGSADEVVINASWGLGESIVGGTVTPDTYVVQKRPLRVGSRTVGDKHRMTVPAPAGTREVEVPRFLRARPALTDLQAAEMAAMALALERRTGHPVDVECAYEGSRLFLLQCRPITTLAPLAATH